MLAHLLKNLSLVEEEVFSKKILEQLAQCNEEDLVELDNLFREIRINIQFVRKILNTRMISGPGPRNNS